MADDQTANRLLVRIEASQAKFEKQMAAIAKSASGGASNIERSFKKANDNAVVSVGATRAAVTNLSFQLNDIAQGLASGTSPFTIMVQQGSQVAQALQGAGGGLVGAVKALGGAFTSILNPVSLASYAIIGLGGAAVQWLLTMRTQLPTVDEALKVHGELLKDIKAYYEGAEESALKYGNTAGIVIDAIARKQQETNKKLLSSQGNAFIDQTNLSGFVTGGNSVIAPQFKAAEEAIKTFRDQLKSGTIDIDAFIASIENSDLTRSLKDNLIEGANALREINGAAQTGPMSEYNKALAAVNAAIQAIDSKPVQAELEAIAKKASEGDMSLREVELALDALSRANPDMQGPISALQALIDKAAEASGAIANINRQGMGPRLGGQENLNDAQFGDRFGGSDSLRNQLQEQKDKIEAEDEAKRKAAEAEAKRQERANRPKKEREDDYERFTRRIQEQTAATQQEYDAQAQLNPLIEDYGLAMEAARLYQEGLNAAKKAGIDLSPAEQAALKAQTDGLATLHAEQERLAEQQGNVKQSFEDWNNTAKDAVGGLISDLTSGKSAAESFANALKKVADQLIEVGLNGIFDSQSGIFGSGGGGGGFNLLSLFGIGSGGFAGGGNTSYFPPIPKFASGTNSAPGGISLVGERGPELVNLPRGSQVIPNAPSMKALGKNSAVNLTYAPQNNFQGTSEELAQMRKIQEQDRREFQARVVDTVRRAQKTRNLN